jgi:hypothetical protein
MEGHHLDRVLCVPDHKRFGGVRVGDDQRLQQNDLGQVVEVPDRYEILDVQSPARSTRERNRARSS